MLDDQLRVSVTEIDTIRCAKNLPETIVITHEESFSRSSKVINKPVDHIRDSIYKDLREGRRVTLHLKEGESVQMMGKQTGDVFTIAIGEKIKFYHLCDLLIYVLIEDTEVIVRSSNIEPTEMEPTEYFTPAQYHSLFARNLLPIKEIGESIRGEGKLTIDYYMPNGSTVSHGLLKYAVPVTEETVEDKVIYYTYLLEGSTMDKDKICDVLSFLYDENIKEKRAEGLGVLLGLLSDTKDARH